MGKKTNYLPNVIIPPQNYPVTNINELVDSVQEYSNPNQATDKYFDQTYYENQVDSGKKVGQNPQDIYSLTGNYLNSEQFKHNNMVPFVGGKIKGYTYDVNISESILDNKMKGTRVTFLMSVALATTSLCALLNKYVFTKGSAEWRQRSISLAMSSLAFLGVFTLSNSNLTSVGIGFFTWDLFFRLLHYKEIFAITNAIHQA
jgi:hypothetical protein